MRDSIDVTGPPLQPVTPNRAKFPHARIRMSARIAGGCRSPPAPEWSTNVIATSVARKCRTSISYSIYSRLAWSVRRTASPSTAGAHRTQRRDGSGAARPHPRRRSTTSTRSAGPASSAFPPDATRLRSSSTTSPCHARRPRDPRSMARGVPNKITTTHDELASRVCGGRKYRNPRHD